MFGYRDKKKVNKTDEQKEYTPIVFINKPAENYLQDVVGFKSQVETIHQAIKNGANMIGVIADYGTGKSTISDILISDVLNNKHKYSIIRINMWDSISKKSDDDNNISELTKSFLYQLANGNNENGHTSKLSCYISKRMSKNFNTISLSTVSAKFRKCGCGAVFLYALYRIFSQSNINFINNIDNKNITVFLNLMKDVNPLFLVSALGMLIYGIIDTSIAFSSWEKTGDNHLESSDIFELYDEIATKLIENSSENKQIVFIEDLDRINDKVLITEFLKELYRFQNSVSKELRDKFVFIVAIKPEALLETKDETAKRENENENKAFEHLYSKVFDVTVNLKPIHFEDYESALLAMFDKNRESRERLVSLIGEDITEDHLPESFNWILLGENLTLRDLKDRLNHAVSIMVSLKNKNYKGNPGINFTACTAVAYLESAFPIEFYRLVQEEEKFESFIRESYSVKNGLDDKKNELIKKYCEIFYGDTSENNTNETEKDKFVDTLCKLILDNVFDDDFRMYFYTYPDNSYIKTVDEKDVCNLIKLPTVFDDVTNLEEKVERIFENKPNSIVISTIRNLNKDDPYPTVLILNRTLFEFAADSNLEKSLQLLCTYTLKSNTADDKILSCLKMINIAQISDKERLISNYSKRILEFVSTEELSKEKFMKLRKNIIHAFEKSIGQFIDLFVNENVSVSIINEDEIELIDNISDTLKLIDKQLVNVEMEYIFNRMNSKKLSDEDCDLASDIYNALIIKDGGNTTLGMYILRFLQNNNLINIEFFNVVLNTVDDTESICEYVNKFKANDLPDEYLTGLDKNVIGKGLSDELLHRMKDKKLFVCYILDKAPKNHIDDIDYLDDDIRKNIISASKILLSEDESIFILLRKSIIRKVQNIYDKYNEIFEGEYPVITKEELNIFDDFLDAIICIDASKLDLENCDFVWEYCNQDKRSAEECLSVFKYLFNIEHKLAVEDSKVAQKLIYALDFDKIRFCELNITQREEAIKYVFDLLSLSDPEEALKFQRHLKTLIPSLEQIIQVSSSTESYLSLLNDLEAYTDTSIQWIISLELNTGLCSAITKELYNKESYVNYVIGKSLFENKLTYDKSLLSVEQYFEIYLNRQCMYRAMSEDKEFISDIADRELYTQISSIVLLKPLYYVPQTAELFKYIWSKLTGEEYFEYIMNINEIATFDDSKSIQKFLCIQENMDKLGAHAMRDRIDFLLWDTQKAYKREFNSCWNKNWKGKLKALENHLL